MTFFLSFPWWILHWKESWGQLEPGETIIVCLCAAGLSESKDWVMGTWGHIHAAGELPIPCCSGKGHQIYLLLSPFTGSIPQQRWLGLSFYKEFCILVSCPETAISLDAMFTEVAVETEDFKKRGKVDVSACMTHEDYTYIYTPTHTNLPITHIYAHMLSLLT